jgi:hypothetical protein
VLREALGDVLEDASNEMNTLARLVLQRLHGQWRELDAHIAWCDQRIAEHARNNPAVRTAATLLGVGPVTASAAVATVDDFKQFNSGAVRGVDRAGAQAALQRWQEPVGDPDSPALEELTEECCGPIGDAYDLVRCLAIELEVQFGFGATVVPVGEGLEFGPTEATFRQTGSPNGDTDAWRLPGDAWLPWRWFSRGDNASSNQA